MKRSYSLVGLQMQRYRDWLAKEISKHHNGVKEHYKRHGYFNNRQLTVYDIFKLERAIPLMILRQCAKQLREKTDA